MGGRSTGVRSRSLDTKMFIKGFLFLGVGGCLCLFCGCLGANGTRTNPCICCLLHDIAVINQKNLTPRESSEPNI